VAEALSIKPNRRQQDALANMSTDLIEIGLNLRWAYFDGYSPNGRAIGEPRGSGMPCGPDQVPGAKLDIGLGSYHSRQAYAEAVRHLGIAEVRVGLALMAITGPNPTIELARPHKDTASLSPALKAIDMMTSRIERINRVCSQRAAGWPRPVLEHLVGNSVAWATQDNAQAALYACRQTLRAALPPANTQQAIMCAVCDIRPANVKAAGCRCLTCYRYLKRNGKERPKSMDKGEDPIAWARQAKRKREALGLGYGNA
jgi:hypothetical protein